MFGMIESLNEGSLTGDLWGSSQLQNKEENFKIRLNVAIRSENFIAKIMAEQGL